MSRLCGAFFLAVCCSTASAQISSFNPPFAIAGSPGFNLTINGQFQNFPSIPPTVTWSNLNQGNLPVISANTTQIVVSVPTNLLTSAGTALITVHQFNLLDISANYVVRETAPAISTINPTSVVAGSASIVLTVNGSNFLNPDCNSLPCPSISIVNWSGIPLTTSYLSTRLLTAVVPANLLLSPVTVPITVVNPDGGTSNAATFNVTYPVPTITSLLPSFANAGGPAFTLSVFGTGLFRGSTIQWNGASLPTILTSTTSGIFLSAPIPAALIAQSGTADVTVVNPGVAVSNTARFTIVAPPTTVSLSLTSLSPATVVEGGPSLSLTVTGSGFTSQTIIYWGTQPLATTFISGSQLTAIVPASLVAKAATVVVTAVNPNQSSSNGLSFVINPTPIAITSLSPASAIAGGAAFTVTVTGTGFLAGVSAVWNGGALTSTYVSATQFTAIVPAALIATAGTASIRAANPNGPQSNSLSFAIAGPTLTLTSIAPVTTIAGGPALTLTVIGTGFQNSSQILWNNSPLATTYVSSTQLTGLVPASLTQGPGSAQVTVSNPGVTPLVSNALTFTITSPPLVLTSLSPTSVPAGSAATLLTVQGSGFTVDSVLLWNGAPLTIEFRGATTLATTIPANLLATPGTASVTVSNGPSQVSNGLTFTIGPRPVSLTITSLSPANTTAGGGAFTLTVNGTGFTANAGVLWNAVSLATAVVSAGQVTAVVPASLIAQTGSASITVTSNGATSNPSTFTIVLPPAPTITLTGPGTIGPAQQPPITFNLVNPYPLPLTGTVTLTFAPNALVPGDDPAIQFASGGRSLGFVVAAKSLTVPSLLLQTGTVAGAVTLTLKLTAGNVDVTPPGSTLTIQIPRQAPIVRTVQLIRNATSLEVDVSGFATSREVTQATFHFNVAAGNNVQVADFTVPLTSTFTAWYGSAAAAPFGSQFTYAQPFTVQGSTAAIVSVTVTLTNTAGVSQAVTSN